MTPVFVDDDGGFSQKGWGFWFVPIIFRNGCRRKDLHPRNGKHARTRERSEATA